MASQQYSRRAFLKTAGYLGVGLAVAGCTLPTVPAGEAAAPSGEKMTLTVWGWWEERMKIFQAAGDDYKAANPNVEVVVETIAEGIWEKIFAAVPAGTGTTWARPANRSIFRLNH